MEFNHPLRVVVLDDKLDEAASLMKAFAAIGIPAVHYYPDDLEDFDEYQEKRPSGVRLLGLDLDLRGTGSTNIKDAIGSITRILRPVLDNGPYGLIIWSNHPDEADGINNAINDYCEGYKPFFKVYISKQDASTPKILKDCILKTIKNDPALYDLLIWESLADCAASNAVKEIANLASKSELNEILTALARGAVGKECESPQQRLRGVHEALAQIHLDIMEQSLSPEHVLAEIDNGKLPLETRAALNSRLLTGASTQDAAPGSVYLFRNWSIFHRPFPEAGAVFNQWKKHFSDGLGNKNDLDNSRQVLVEVTPSCDFAQKKTCGLRLITGILHPNTINSSAPFLKCIGPILYKNKPYTLVLYSRAILGSVRNEPIPHPIFRIRQAPLQEIQGWLASMASRVGVISV